MLYGTRIALSIGVIAVSIYVTIGIFIGSMAGFFGGIVDLVVVRFIEIFMAIPSLFVILTLLAFVEKPSIFHIMMVIGLLRWTGVARLVRSEFLRLRNLDFVNAAIALGFPTHRIIFQHILPNALGPVLVNATFGVASAILIESTLVLPWTWRCFCSFLGTNPLRRLCNVCMAPHLDSGYRNFHYCIVAQPIG